jgi:hypothetical protein
MTDLTRPIAGDPLASSNGEASTVILDEAFDVIEANEDAISARTSDSIITTDQFADLTTSVLNAAESLSDGTGTWVAVGAHSSSVTSSQSGGGTITSPLTLVSGTLGTTGNPQFTTGTSAVRAALDCQTTSMLCVNLPAPVTIGSYTQLSFDVRWDDTGSGSLNQARFSVGASDGTNLSGTRTALQTISAAAPVHWAFATVVINLTTLTTGRSIGIVGNQGGGPSRNCVFWIDNVKLLGATGLDQALDSATTVAVVVPPDYTTTQTQNIINLGSTKSLLDLRPGKTLLSNNNGEYSLRQWNLDETGTTNVAAELAAIINSLPSGSKLTAPKNAKYLIRYALNLSSKEGMLLDFNGASFFQDQDSPSDDMWGFTGWNNCTVRNFHLFGVGDIRNGGSFGLSTSGQATTVSYSNTRYARNYDGNCVMKATLSQATPAASDATLQWRAYLTGEVLASQTLTLTSTPTVYTLNYKPRDLGELIIPYVVKNTAAASPVVGFITEIGRVAYRSAYATQHAIAIGPDCKQLTIEDWSAEGFGGDAFSTGGAEGIQGLTIRRFFSRAMSRQGWSINQGDGPFWISQFVCREGARWGVDIEPETSINFVNNLNIEDGELINNDIGAIETGFGTMENVYYSNIICRTSKGDNTNLVDLGGRGGYIRNVYQLADETSGAGGAGNIEPSFQIVGQNLVVEDCIADRGFVFVDKISNANGERTGGNIGRNLHVTRPGTYGGIIVRSRNTTIIGGSTTHDLQTFTPGQGGTAGKGIGPFSLMSDSRFSALDPGPHLTTYPKTYKGLAHSSVWVPGGFDHLDDPVIGVRALSGGTVKGNNLRGLAQAITAGSTTATVAFPVRSYPNTTGISLVGSGPEQSRILMDLSHGVPPFHGTWTLTYNGQSTPAFYDSTDSGFPPVQSTTAAQLQTALRAIPTVDPTVTVAGTSIFTGTGLTITWPAALGNVPHTLLSMANTMVDNRGWGDEMVSGAHLNLTTPVQGGSLAAGTYFYRAASIDLYGGPTVPATEVSAALSGSQNAMSILVGGWNSAANQRQTAGFTLYRGTASGTYTSRFDFRPNVPLYQMANSSVQFFDLGSTLAFVAESYISLGYPPSTAVTAGTWTVAVGGNQLKDETGWEPDTNYAVFVVPSWPTTVSITAKRTNGFDIGFGVACPVGGGTFDWLLVR